MGKTTWLSKNLQQHEPFILIDPLYDPKFEQLGLYPLESAYEAMELFMNGKPNRVYCSPNARTFDFICALVLARGDITLIVDECDNYATSLSMPPYFKSIVKYGRHKQVNLIAACRRPHEMNMLIRSQANLFIIFPMGGEDSEHLKPYIGKGYIKEIEKLKFGEFMEYNFSTRKAEIKNIDLTFKIKVVDITEQ